MFSYFDDGLHEYNVFADLNPSSVFDDSFNPQVFPTYTKFFEDIHVSNRTFIPLDTPLERLSDSSSSHLASTPEANDDSDSNRSLSENSNVLTSHFNEDVGTSLTVTRRRSWNSFRRSLPANLLIDSPGHHPYKITKNLRLAPPSRNKQASHATSRVISRVMNSNLREQANVKFVCPECGWRQINKRIPDFKRHLKTHLRPKDGDHSSGHWCCGVRVEDAREYTIHPDATPYKFQEHQRIGGCMRTFSRRDALKRHIANANNSCVGGD